MKKKKSRIVKNIIGNLIIAVGVVGGLYVGGWLMFIQPIIEACNAFDTGTLTGLIIGVTILKCIFAMPVSSIIACIGVFVGSVLKLYKSYKHIQYAENEQR